MGLKWILCSWNIKKQKQMLLIYLMQFYFQMNLGAVMVKDVTLELSSVFWQPIILSEEEQKRTNA